MDRDRKVGGVAVCAVLAALCAVAAIGAGDTFKDVMLYVVAGILGYGALAGVAKSIP